jgi:hypothetical protein
VPDDLREDAEAMAYFDRTFEELASAVEARLRKRRAYALDRRRCRCDSRSRALSHSRRAGLRSHPQTPDSFAFSEQGTESLMLWTILIIVVIAAVALYLFRRIRRS